MYLYNVTIIADNDAGPDIRRDVDAQLAGQPGLSAPIALLEMLDSPHEGITFCVQLKADTPEEIAWFQRHQLAAIRALLEKKHAGKVLFFDSTLKYLTV